MGSKEAVVVKVIGDRCEKDNHSIMNELCMGLQGDSMEKTLEVNVSSGSKSLTKVNLRIIDTTSLGDTGLYLSAANVVIIVYSVVDMNSFNNVKKTWVKRVKEASKKLPIILVALRVELRATAKPTAVVTTEQGRTLKRDINASAFYEISAHDIAAVKEVFCKAAQLGRSSSTIEKVLLWRKPKCVIDNNNIHINDNNNNSPKRGSLGAPLIHSPSSADSRLVRSDSYPTKPTIATPVNLPVNSLQTSPSAPIQRLAFRTPDMQPKILHDENAKELESWLEANGFNKRYVHSLVPQRYDLQSLRLLALQGQSGATQKLTDLGIPEGDAVKIVHLVRYEPPKAKFGEKDYLTNIVIGKELGSGKFGKVFHGIRNNSTQVALKCLRSDTANEGKIIEEFYAEAYLLKECNDPNVLRYLGLFREVKDGITSNIYIVTEYMTKGCLQKLLITDHSIDLTRKLKMARDIASGMIYLATKDIVHRDLACRNCLVDDAYVVKVGDLGMSRTIDVALKDAVYKSSSDIMPQRWCALESLEKGIFDTRTDVWAFGVCFWEIINNGADPYMHRDQPGNSRSALISYLKKGRRLERRDECPEEVFKIMLACWNEDPDKRPTFHQIFQMLTDLIEPPSESSEEEEEESEEEEETDGEEVSDSDNNNNNNNHANNSKAKKEKKEKKKEESMPDPKLPYNEQGDLDKSFNPLDLIEEEEEEGEENIYGEKVVADKYGAQQGEEEGEEEEGEREEEEDDSLFEEDNLNNSNNNNSDNNIKFFFDNHTLNNNNNTNLNNNNNAEDNNDSQGTAKPKKTKKNKNNKQNKHNDNNNSSSNNNNPNSILSLLDDDAGEDIYGEKVIGDKYHQENHDY